MQSNLKDVAQDFARGVDTLAALREAAHAEVIDRRLAGEVLRLIAVFEGGSGWSRNELRTRMRQIAPTPPPESKPRYEGSMYDAGLRGQRRRG